MSSTSHVQFLRRGLSCWVMMGIWGGIVPLHLEQARIRGVKLKEAGTKAHICVLLGLRIPNTAASSIFLGLFLALGLLHS